MNLLHKLALTALCVSSITLPQAYISQKYKVGETITINHYQNGSTGYLWYFINPKTKEESTEPFLSDSDCVKFTESWTDFAAAMCGQGCNKYWAFKTVKPGITRLTMVYKRSWEPGSVSDTAHYTIEVVA